MRRARLGWLAVAAVVVAAGCQGGGDDRPAGGERARRLSLVSSEPVKVAARGSAPSIAAAGRSGDVYLAWVEDTPAAAHHAHGPGREGHGDGPPGRRVVVAHSMDGRRELSEAVVASGADTDVAAAPVRIALGPEGEIYVLYEREVPHERLPYYSPRPRPAEARESGRRALRLARSTDGGRTFEAVDVGAADVEGARTSTSRAGLVVAPGGEVFAGWLDFREEFALLALPQDERPDLEFLGLDDPRAPRVEVRVARSTDGGASFRKSVRVGEAASERAPVALAAGPDGALHVAWRSRLHRSSDDYGTAMRDVLVSTSTDGGWSWSPAAKVHDDRFNVSECPGVTSGLAVDSKGRLHVAWYSGARRAAGFYYATSDDRGRTFSEPITLLRDDWVPYGDAKIAVGEAGNAWVVFADHRTDTRQFVVARIEPGGRVALSDPRAGTAPDLAAANEGVPLAWTTSDGAIAVTVASAGG